MAKGKRAASSEGEAEVGSMLAAIVKPRPSTDNAESGGEAAEIEETAEGDPFFKLSDYRRVTVRTFKGKTLIDIRETYKDKASGEMKPGSKGISLTPEQASECVAFKYQVLKSNIGSIDQMISKVEKK
ncbi:hypothetical protein B9479_002320 [Cryptococcus floricola]|uniref:Transcriptional coactivator p15 (PC4) C-terminal domain-containing protein n=1 Tax=Cryptococcus floricola TaxID=2591691 RepID=A0A5D3B3E6_9TREE|nr:hypothetical protein B9479_002320 [Cryptococcus floricola]